MRDIDLIVIHCSDTPDDRPVTAVEIERWHTAPKPMGNGWSDIGYHYVIRRDGGVEAGRALDKPGAHVRGKNSHSVGLCLVGRQHYSDEQLYALDKLILELTQRWPDADVKGHCDFDKGKSCPNFDVTQWWQAREDRA